MLRFVGLVERNADCCPPEVREEVGHEELPIDVLIIPLTDMHSAFATVRSKLSSGLVADYQKNRTLSTASGNCKIPACLYAYFD